MPIAHGSGVVGAPGERPSQLTGKRATSSGEDRAEEGCRAGCACPGRNESRRSETFPMLYMLISLLVVVLVWILATTLGLPYLVAVVVTLLAAVYLFGPGRGAIAPRRAPRRSR